MLVAKHLDLNMARVLNEFLKIDFAVVERSQRFTLSHFKTGLKIGGLSYQTHSLATAARRSLDHYRKTNLGRRGFCFRKRQAPRRAGNRGNPSGLHRRA